MKKQRRHIERAMKIESKTEVLAGVRLFVSQAAREFGFDEDDVMKIEIAVDEACTNIIKHAYENKPGGLININVEGNSGNGRDKFIVSISDTGKSFDSEHYKAPDMARYFQRMQRGGLGVILMKKIMDEVEYGSTKTRGNSIRLVKYRSQTAQRS